MNKSMIVVGVVVLLVIVGGGWYFSNQNSKLAEQTNMTQEKAAMEEKAAMKSKEIAVMKKDEIVMEKKEDKMINKTAASRYVEYSKAALDQAAGGRRVLYFYANWCPVCRPADANFKEKASKIPGDVTVVRVNYNDTDTDQEEKDLAKKYGITYQHTFVQIDGQEKQVTKWNGGQVDDLLANIK